MSELHWFCSAAGNLFAGARRVSKERLLVHSAQAAGRSAIRTVALAALLCAAPAAAQPKAPALSEPGASHLVAAFKSSLVEFRDIFETPRG